MSMLDKLNFLLENNELTMELVDFTYEINKKLWCERGQYHLGTWCEGACRAMKFLGPIIDCFNKNISLEEKKNVIICYLTHIDTFDALFKSFIW